MSAWINLRFLGRGKHFRHSERILQTLRSELRQRDFDSVVFSGDATAMGFEEGMRRAAELLELDGPERLPGLAVPGNHDYCTSDAERSGHFERYFASWQSGQRIAEEVYPFAQRVGHVWLIGVNSATANHWAWDARGRVGAAQLERLQKLLATLPAGPRILVTHYPIVLADGMPERAFHGLRDLDDLIATAVRGGVALWLHGHRHDCYHHHSCSHAPFPVLCAGSVTQRHRWSYNDCTLNGSRLCVVQRVYNEDGDRFRDGRVFELELPPSAAIT